MCLCLCKVYIFLMPISYDQIILRAFPLHCFLCYLTPETKFSILMECRVKTGSPNTVGHEGAAVLYGSEL